MSYQLIRVSGTRLMYLDNNGHPAANYKVWTCVAGTVDTLTTTWQDRLGLVANTNPLVLDARGQAQCWALVAIKLVLCVPASTGPGDGVIQYDDWLAEQTLSIVNSVAADPGTVNNNYTASTTPLYASIPDGFSLSLIPDVTNEDTLVTLPGETSPTVFDGTGINDGRFSGPYIGSTAGSVFNVVIDSVGGPAGDTFKWRKDAGAWTTLVPITAEAQSLIEGIAITFAVSTGHTITDEWSVTVQTPVRFDFCGLGSVMVYKNVEGLGRVPLDGGDIIAKIPAHLDYSLTESCWILLNPSLPALETLLPTMPRKVISTNYTIKTTDRRTELACVGGVGGITLTLPPLPDIPGFDIYIKRVSGDITIEVDGSVVTDVIWLPFFQSSVTSFVMPTCGYDCVRLATNGIDVHILDATTRTHGTQSFNTAGGTWTCPEGVTTVYITGTAAGAGGDSNVGGTAGDGGGNGQAVMKYAVTVVPLTAYTITVGTKGAGGTGTNPGAAGGNTSFGALLTLTGGVAGVNAGGFVTIDVTTIFFAGYGQGSAFGGGGIGATGTTATFIDGGDASGYGAGGGGSAGQSTGTGGDGSDGFLVVEW